MTPSRPVSLLRLLWLLPLAGCFIATPLAPSEGPDEGQGTEIVPQDEDDDTGVTADTRWGVSGTLVVVGEQPDPAASRLELQTRGVDCGVAATLQTARPLVDPPEGVDAGWTLEVVAEPGDACTWRGPTTFLVGVGRVDPQLRPAADRAGIAWDGASGLYLGTPGDPLFLVGLARPVETDTGGADDTDAPTAAFDLTTLHGIPLDR